jgi:hypothetical protein
MASAFHGENLVVGYRLLVAAVNGALVRAVSAVWADWLGLDIVRSWFSALAVARRI